MVQFLSWNFDHRFPVYPCSRNSEIPMAALAAILVYIGFRLSSPATFKKIYSMGLEQLIFMVVTIVITLYSDLLVGIIGGSLFTLLVHILLSRMPVREFFKKTFSNETNVFVTKEGDYNLKVEGIASFLTVVLWREIVSFNSNIFDSTSFGHKSSSFSAAIFSSLVKTLYFFAFSIKVSHSISILEWSIGVKCLK